MHEPDVKQNDLTDAELTELLHGLRCPDDIEPRPGFYAKVMDRIESQQKSSIWSVFLEPVFSKRLAFASMALIMLLGVAFFNAAPGEDETLAMRDGGSPVVWSGNEDQAAPVLGGGRVDALHASPVAMMGAEQGRDVVLVDLVSYQEH